MTKLKEFINVDGMNTPPPRYFYPTDVYTVFSPVQGEVFHLRNSLHSMIRGERITQRAHDDLCANRFIKHIPGTRLPAIYEPTFRGMWFLYMMDRSTD